MTLKRDPHWTNGLLSAILIGNRSRHGVGFTTICAIGAYHH